MCLALLLLLCACQTGLETTMAGDAADQPTAVAEEPFTSLDLPGQLARLVEEPSQVQFLLNEFNSAVEELMPALQARGSATREQVAKRLEEQVSARLAERHEKNRRLPLPTDEKTLQQQVIRFEAFRLGTYLSAGVFPKRYFGYLDLAWDTAAAEAILVRIVHCASAQINPWLAARGQDWRVNDAEIAITFIAEGGAPLLGEDQRRMNTLHPVLDVGLDDLASGLGDRADLLSRLDSGCGTDLAGTVTFSAPGVQPADALDRLAAPPGQDAWLTRYATFEEGIIGTALMWTWEKSIAETKLRAEGRAPLAKRDRTEQFILGSLVYNSGLTHSESTLQAIKTFQSGELLAERSEANASRRPRLDLLAPTPLQAEWLATGTYRLQPTSWNGAYHVLQRYGAWEAVRRFSEVFQEDGAWSQAWLATATRDGAP